MRPRFLLIASRRTESEWTFEVEVPRDSPFFDGHFPGRPVLPAIAQLAILTELTRESIDPLRSIGAIPQLRFQQNIQPDQRLTFHVGHAGDDGRSSFAIRHEGQAVSRGAIVWRTAS